MTPTVQTTRSTFPVVGLLGVAFIVLKLTGVIAWSWWWVLAPFWIPLALTILFLLVAVVIMAVAESGKPRKRREMIKRMNR